MAVQVSIDLLKAVNEIRKLRGYAAYTPKEFTSVYEERKAEYEKTKDLVSAFVTPRATAVKEAVGRELANTEPRGYPTATDFAQAQAAETQARGNPAPATPAIMGALKAAFGAIGNAELATAQDKQAAVQSLLRDPEYKPNRGDGPTQWSKTEAPVPEIKEDTKPGLTLHPKNILARNTEVAGPPAPTAPDQSGVTADGDMITMPKGVLKKLMAQMYAAIPPTNSEGG